MKNLILTISILLTLQGCNTYKKAQKDIYSSNFDQALEGMIKKYVKGNIKEKDIVRWSSIFNEAYQKANASNLDRISQSEFLPEGSEKHRSILTQYLALQSRYDRLKPILPIRVGNEIIAIYHYNYGRELESASLKLANALTNEADVLMATNNKMAARLAYEKYSEVAQLVPNYTSNQEKLNQAYHRGLSHILITINNDSRAVLPRNLYNDLTYFDATNNRFFWQKFHTQPSGQTFDYTLELNFRKIAVTPELIDRSHQIYKREWIDSSEVARASDGRVMKDSTGRPLKIFAKRNSKAKVIQLNQSKSAHIQSEFLVYDRNHQLVSRISPIQSNFSFQNVSYTIQGDEDAVDRDLIRRIKRQVFLPFPSTEQMVYDCGLDLKGRFADFIASNIEGK